MKLVFGDDSRAAMNGYELNVELRGQHRFDSMAIVTVRNRLGFGEG